MFSVASSIVECCWGSCVQLFLGETSLGGMLYVQFLDVCVSLISRTEIAMPHSETPLGHFHVFFPCLKRGTILGVSSVVRIRWSYGCEFVEP